MKQKTCCFSGHRKILQDKRSEVENRLRFEIENLICEGVTRFCCGGALGFDTLCALIVLHLKSFHPQISLVLVLPCKNQSAKWNEKDIALYRSIVSKADEVVYVSEQYTPGCMQKRNRLLVSLSNICICYLHSSFGGTFYTVNHAKKEGLRVINIA